MKKIPVLIFREFVCNALKLIHELISKIAKTGQEIANSLLFSLFSGNSRGRGTFTLPNVTQPWNTRRWLRQNVFILLPLVLVAGIVLGWMLHAF
jgi:hypothetical protein